MERITTFDERFYKSEDVKNKKTGGYYFVSTTHCIKRQAPTPIGLMKWIAQNGWDDSQRIMKEAGDFGSLVHDEGETMIKDVNWGEIDYLIVDSPPGTGDEPLSVCQLIEDADGAVIVTTPQDIALIDVKKSINFCKKLNLRVLGVIENMSGFICPHCNNTVNIFKSGGGKTMADAMNVPFLGSIPLVPEIVTTCDSGTPYVSRHSEDTTVQTFNAIIHPIIEMDGTEKKNQNEENKNMNNENLRIAIPMADGKLAQHFGHCEKFLLCDVDLAKKEIINNTMVTPPMHEPGILPPWLAKQGVHKIITGGMGQRALSLFNQQRIEVIAGAQSDEPEKVVRSYLDGTLITGGNICDH